MAGACIDKIISEEARQNSQKDIQILNAFEMS